MAPLNPQWEALLSLATEVDDFVMGDTDGEALQWGGAIANSIRRIALGERLETRREPYGGRAAHAALKHAIARIDHIDRLDHNPRQCAQIFCDLCPADQ